MTRSVALSSRLSRIYHLSKDSKTIADIGSDHGLLAIELVQSSSDLTSLVYCIDNSLLALKNGIYQNIKKVENNIKDKLVIINGDGLVPLIKQKKQIETVILAGLGAHTIDSILDVDLHPLGCKQLIIQPFPCNFKDVLPLYRGILSRHTRWNISDIAVDYENRQFYLTSVFSLMSEHVSEHASGRNHQNVVTLNDLPLKNIQDKSVLFRYLRKQQELLMVKRRGLVYDGDDGTYEFQYLLLLLKQIEELLPTEHA